MCPATLSFDTARQTATAVRFFTPCVLAIIVLACLAAGWAPVTFSIVTVFLFAGPHNWLEARYLMTRMPPRWGKLRGYFLLGVGGVPLLTAAFIALPSVLAATDGSRETWLVGLAVWNTALVLWVSVLVSMRARQNPRRDWPWLWPAAFVLLALAWLFPYGWGLLLVYAHPLVALAFLDVEVGRRCPLLRPYYRGCLLCVPIALAVLAWRLAGTPDLPGDDVLTLQIARHAGGGYLSIVSSHLLVSSHTFLEMLHYGVWCFALPVMAFNGPPWKLQNVPLARASAGWGQLLRVVMVVGLGIMVVLWMGFVIDYPFTRSVYFTIAMVHVLMEIPFLLRMV